MILLVRLLLVVLPAKAMVTTEPMAILDRQVEKRQSRGFLRRHRHLNLHNKQTEGHHRRLHHLNQAIAFLLHQVHRVKSSNKVKRQLSMTTLTNHHHRNNNNNKTKNSRGNSTGSSCRNNGTVTYAENPPKQTLVMYILLNPKCRQNTCAKSSRTTATCPQNV